MKIKELSLKNFKSVADQSFKFDNGIICFSGNNGEGKSTVIHAILILLFNSYDMSFKDYINWNASKFFISISFEHNGNEFYEEFEYAEKGGSKRVLKNLTTDEIWENSSAISVLSDIIDPDLAKASIVSMENEQNLITTTPSKRREYLKGVYNLEFKEQLDSISNDLAHINHDEIRCNAEIAAYEKQEFEYKNYESEPYSEEEYNMNKDNISILNAKKGELELQKQKRDEIKLKLDEANLSIRRQTVQMSAIESKIKTAENDISLNELDLKTKENEDRIPELNEKLNKLKSDHDVAVESLVSEIDKYDSEVIKFSADSSLAKTLTDIRNNINEKELKKREVQILMLQSKEKLKVLVTGKCPTCGHIVSEEETNAERNVLSELENKFNAIDSELTELKNSYGEVSDKYEQQHKDLDSAKLMLARTKTSLDVLNANFNQDSMKIKHEIEMYTINKENAVARLKANINNNKKIIESQIEIKSQAEELLDRYRESVASLTRELDAIDDPDTAISELATKIEDLQSTVKKYEDVRLHNEWVKKYNEEQDAKAKKRDEKVKILKTKLSECIERRNMTEKAKAIVVKEFPSFVISYMVKSLENYANEFLQKVYPKYILKITESKNSLAITYGPRNADVKMASGFEKSAFSLAYMYALGKIQKYGMLIIDEGDGAASDGNSLMFYNTVAKSQEFFPQIFCITHKEVAKDLLQNTYNAEVYTAESGCYYKF